MERVLPAEKAEMKSPYGSCATAAAAPVLMDAGDGPSLQLALVGAVLRGKLDIEDAVIPRHLDNSGPCGTRCERPGISDASSFQGLREILENLQHSESVAVLGEGPFSIEVSLALSELGKRVELVSASEHLLEGVIGRSAAEILRRRLQAKNIGVWVSSDLEEISSVERCDMRIGSIELRGAEFLKCQMVISAAEPSVASGYGGTPAPYAVPFVSGDGTDDNGPRFVRITSQGFDLTAYRSDVPAASDGCGFLELVNNARMAYRSARFSDTGDIVEAVRLGDEDWSGVITNAIFSPYLIFEPSQFVFAGVDPLGADDALGADAPVCRCNATSKEQVRSVLNECASLPVDLLLEQVVARTKATTGCGGCRDLLRSLVVEGWSGLRSAARLEDSLITGRKRGVDDGRFN